MALAKESPWPPTRRRKRKEDESESGSDDDEEGDEENSSPAARNAGTRRRKRRRREAAKFSFPSPGDRVLVRSADPSEPPRLYQIMQPLRPGSGGGVSGSGAGASAEKRRRTSGPAASDAATAGGGGNGGNDDNDAGDNDADDGSKPRTFRAKELTTEARTEADWLSKAAPEERVALTLDPRKFWARTGRPRKGGSWCFDKASSA